MKGPTMSQFKIPTAAELYALEQQAHRARAVELARLARQGARWVKDSLKAAFTRPYAARPGARGVRHA
jgi:hypothetical protein